MIRLYPEQLRAQLTEGLRAAYLLRAEKRAFPMTPMRLRKPLALSDGVSAA